MTRNLLSSADSWKSPGRRWILYLLFYAVGANLVFWLAAARFGLVLHGWICFDYLVVGFVSLFLPRSAAAVLLGTAILLDLLSGVCETFYIAPIQIFKSGNALAEFSWRPEISIAAIILLLVAVAWSSILLHIPKGAKHSGVKAAAGLITLASICFAVEFVQAGAQARVFLLHPSGGFGSADMLNEARFHRMRPARYSTHKLLLESLFEHRVEQLAKQSQFEVVNSASGAAISLISNHAWQTAEEGEKPNVVLILVESWGLPLDSAIRTSLVSPYADRKLLDKYRVVQGRAPFFGSTVPGEVRELCGNTSGFEILRIASAEQPGCLPDRFAAAGYRNIAVHGMDGHLFDRVRWYPQLGFNEILFREQFENLGLPICPGAFRGTCDADIANWIGLRLAQPDAKPKFIYWVTLNSHLPVPNPPLLSNPAPCFAPELVQQHVLCDWYQLIANLHQSVSALARSTARPTVFIVVGDHAPPFSSPLLRAQFSQTDVPYVLLIPSTMSSEIPAVIHSNANLKLPAGTHAKG